VEQHTRRFYVDIRPYFRYYALANLARKGRDLETHLTTERVRFLRTGLVTPFSGGPGFVPAGTTTGARGAPLKRDWRRG
jgi:hypothetical protein